MSGRMQKKREVRADQPIDVQAIQEKNDHEINEHILRIIDYRTKRKWHATAMLIAIFGGLVGLILWYVSLGKDVMPEWKEILLVMLGGFVASFSKVIDYWFNQAENENKMLEAAND